ncbi:hypothetical protein LCGC14_1320870 [marine sediment metagenome]|uniref:DUF1643 domain-containing protein n=1 Tax=marine sediment metagenome TaxID=412755 RepID=A0A0F9NLY0_9ZZZZ
MNRLLDAPQRPQAAPDILRAAHFSPDMLYRYGLTRQWGPGGMVLFILLNPSTADAIVDDATVRRCIAFALAWGYGGLYIVNLFAFRSTDPRELLRVRDPIGAQNDHALSSYAEFSSLHVAAWGTHGALKERGRAVRDTLSALGYQLYHLGLTQGGHPRHPLYLAKSTKPQVWN